MISLKSLIKLQSNLIILYEIVETILIDKVKDKNWNVLHREWYIPYLNIDSTILHSYFNLRIIFLKSTDEC